MQIAFANPKGFHAGEERSLRAGGARVVAVAPAVSMPATGTQA
jgi:hypothetical protein